MPADQVRKSDLMVDNRDYIFGPGDVVTVTIYELRSPGIEDIQTLRINETGMIRLAVVGAVRAAGLSEHQLENNIREKLDTSNILRDATVSVITQRSQQNTYTVIASPTQGGSAPGTYIIPKPDFRLLEALSQARGAPERTRRIFVIRAAALAPEFIGNEPEPEPGQRPSRPAPVDPGDLLEGLGDGLMDAGPGNNPAADRGAPPVGVEAGLDDAGNQSQWVYVDGKWVRVANAPGQDDGLVEDEDLSSMVTQRIIEIPYGRLKGGDMRYNIVIRPGDVITIPGRIGGFVYAMGAISRPGAYTVPGEYELTLMRLVASAGGPSQLAWPERVDLVRQVSEYEQIIVRLDLKAIAQGHEPDIYLRANDIINIGTSGAAVPLAVFRNGLRMTYGFGFVLDRNFNQQVFGP